MDQPYCDEGHLIQLVPVISGDGVAGYLFECDCMDE